MTFLEFHRYEIDAATYVSPWEKWCAKVEKILGHDLDGDQSMDGYSLDFALEMYERGISPEDYAAGVTAYLSGVCAGCGHVTCQCELELAEAEEMWEEERL